jgi:hypothetical protein
MPDPDLEEVTQALAWWLDVRALRASDINPQAWARLAPVVAAARRYVEMMEGAEEVAMRVLGTIDDMKVARKSLGSPAALNEALVATGIDALFVLLDGRTVEIEGRRVRLVPVSEEEK